MGTPPARNPFRNLGGRLHCDQVSLATVADAVGTPAYVYSGAAIDGAYAEVVQALAFAPHSIAYAVKANDTLAILARLGRLGCGADVVSMGELYKATTAGIPASRIVFSGVGKRDDELEYALAAGVRAVHIESAQELTRVIAIAERRGERARIALRINPDVDPKTHPYIATGLRDSKFGLPLDVARGLIPQALASRAVELCAVACHIGSQLGSPLALEEAVAITGEFAKECIAAGAPIDTLDAGGGWPVAYDPAAPELPGVDAFAQAIARGLARTLPPHHRLALMVEPGRALLAHAGVLLTRVIAVKEQATTRFAVVDAGMTELIRPALYGAYHHITAVSDAGTSPRQRYDVVGPVCESADFLGKQRELPELAPGSLIAVHGAGAYATTMSSQYNGRPRAAAVMVDGDSFRVVRDRGTLDDLIRDEHV